MRLISLLICSLALLATTAGATDLLHDATANAEARLGASISALLDQDGDGDDELLVGAPTCDVGGLDAGRVCLWIGGTALTLNPAQVWDGSPGEQFGHAVSRIGDINGDGRDDFAVGAPLADAGGSENGRVYVYYGDEQIASDPDLVLDSPAAGAHFGWSLASLGDLDGDGRDDFAVGAPLADTAAFEAGAVYVYLGGSPGPSPDLILLGSLAYDRFGWSVAGVGTFLGGSTRCLAVGAPANGNGAGTRQGSVVIYRGLDGTPDLTLYSDASVTADNEFGYSVAAVGSVDGDSDPDLAVGAPRCDDGGAERGLVEIFFGGSDADAAPDRSIGGPAAGARLGWSVAGVGDVVGTSRPDVLMGAPFTDVLATDAGRAFLWAGGSGDVSDADALDEVIRDGFVAAPAGDQFGAWCAWIGDLDGDGLDDYAVGAPEGNAPSSSVAGWVRFVDSSGGAVPLQWSDWSCRWEDDGGLQGSLLVGSLMAADLATVRLEREDAGAHVVLLDGCLDGRLVTLAGGRCRVSDPDAAWQTRGDLRYRLSLTLISGEVLQAELAGPADPRPSTAPRLAPAAPNPCNPATRVLWRASAGTRVSVTVYDSRGRLVQRLRRGVATGAWESEHWRGTDHAGRRQAAGVYLIRLDAGDRSAVRRVTLIP